jgi:hypothetical protein
MSDNAHLADFLGDDILGETKVEPEKAESIWFNTGWVTPAQLLDKAKELASMAQEASEKDVFVRVWCDKGEKSHPYTQIRVDNTDKVTRWKKIQEAKLKRSAGADFASKGQDDLTDLLG